jgi:hypothetical protein
MLRLLVTEVNSAEFWKIPSSRVFEPVQHLDGGARVFHAVKVLDEVLDGGGFVLIHVASARFQQLRDFSGCQISDADDVCHYGSPRGVSVVTSESGVAGLSGIWQT